MRIRRALVLLAVIVLSAAQAQAVTWRSCRRACNRFARHCTLSIPLSGRCQRIFDRLDVCEHLIQDLPCEAIATTTTVTTSTTSTTLPEGAVP